MQKFKVTPSEVKQRVDIFTLQRMPKVSRAFIHKLSQQNSLLVNGNPVKAGYRLRADDVVNVDYDPGLLDEIPHIILPVIYEDADCIVIDKPIGILAHSKGIFNPEATVATFIKDKVADLHGERAGIVHRLDRVTSGVMIAAKNQRALNWLQAQFSSRKVKKTYYAVVDGLVTPREAVIDMPIERHPKTPQIFRTGSKGKSAQTRYTVVKNSEHYSLIKLEPQTGRTHQLRVHLQKIGHPIVGDVLYGGSFADRVYLHANALEMTLPSSRHMTLESPLPKEFNDLVES